MTDYHDLSASVACTLSSLLPPKYRWRDVDVRETVATLMAKHDRGVDYAIGDRLHKAEREVAFLRACRKEVTRLKRTKRRVVPFKPTLVPPDDVRPSP